MSFSITNNSADAVVTKIETLSTAYGSFTVTSGSFPLLSGDTISGTNTQINNGMGSPEGSILLFLVKGNAQIEYYLNGNLISANDYSSGLIEIKGPIIKPGDTVAINVDEAVLPVPSSTPAVTPSVTPTMTVTPTQTPSTTPTMTPTPSSTPIPSSDPAELGATYWVDFTDQASLTLNNLGGGNYTIENATDQIASIVFTATTGSPGNIPYYQPTGFNGVSGCTINQNGNPIQNLSGVFTATTDWTFAAYIYDDGTQAGGQTWQMFQSVFNTTPRGGARNNNITLYSWEGQGSTTSITPIAGSFGLTPSTWVSFIVRVKSESAGQTRLSIYENNTLQFENVYAGTPFVVTDPIHAFVWGGGTDRMTECSFYDRALTIQEITELNNYLSNKY